MKSEQISTIFLRLVIFFIGILILALCIFLLPWIAKELLEYYPAYLIYPALICFYASSIPFYFALYQTLKLLNYIDKNTAFAEVSVKALINIKYCAVIVCVLHIAVLPILHIIAEADDAPGLILMGLVIPGASMVIAVFAAVLQRLLKDALDIKKDNDLTI